MRSSPTAIPSVLWLHDFGEVPVENGSFASYVRDERGHEWICKQEDNTGWQSILAEAVGWMLGCRLGAPVPRVALYEGESGRAWLSARVPFAAHWAARHRDAIQNLDALAAMIALDALLLNEDRHAGNILLQPAPDARRLHAWAIDMGGAIIGHVDDAAQRESEPPSPHNHARGLPIEQLCGKTMQAALLAEALSPEELETIARVCCKAAREPDPKPLLAVLTHRCQNATPIVAGYLDLLRGLT